LIQKRKLVIVGIVLLVVGCSMIAVTLIGLSGEQWAPVNNNLNWADISNSTLIYDFIILGEDGSGEIIDNWWPLNNSQFRITIQTLPSLPKWIEARTFIEDIANIGKVQVSQVNGSDVTYSIGTRVREVVSFLIFPTGDWEYFESQFGEKVEITYQDGQFPKYYEYIGSSTSDSVYDFTRKWNQQGSGHGAYYSTTYGNIDKNTGIPTYISHYYLFSHVAGFDYTLILSLAD